jgi:hypothetical protein
LDNLFLNLPSSIVIIDIIKDKLMAEQINSKSNDDGYVEWVDYSDEDSSEEEHH